MPEYYICLVIFNEIFKHLTPVGNAKDIFDCIKKKETWISVKTLLVSSLKFMILIPYLNFLVFKLEKSTGAYRED